MGRLSASLLALALGAVAALCLIACGGSGADLLPGDTASEINSNLDRVQELVREQDCVGAEDAAQEVSSEVAALGGVDKKLKQTLREGATKLTALVEGCEEVTTEETSPAIETAIEPEEDEVKKTKPEKPEAAAKEPKETNEAPPATTTPATTPQTEGEDTQESGEEAPPAETGSGDTSAGGVGPAAPAGSE
jgi:hypothetical protein